MFICDENLPFLKQLIFEMNTVSLSWWIDILRKDEEEKSMLLCCNLQLKLWNDKP